MHFFKNQKSGENGQKIEAISLRFCQKNLRLQHPYFLAFLTFSKIGKALIWLNNFDHFFKTSKMAKN